MIPFEMINQTLLNMKTMEAINWDALVMGVSLGFILFLIGSLVYAIITGQVDTSRLG